MIKSLAGLLYRLPWAPRVEAEVVEVNHWLQLKRVNLVVAYVFPRGSSPSVRINGASLAFNEMPDYESPFVPTEKEDTVVIEFTFENDDPETVLRLEVSPPGKTYSLKAQEVTAGELKPTSIHLPILYKLDGRFPDSTLKADIVYGWCFALNPLQVTKIQARLDETSLSVEFPLEREDIADNFSDQEDSNKCGFECELPPDKTDGTLTLECQLDSGAWIEICQTNLDSVEKKKLKTISEDPSPAAQPKMQSLYNVETILVEQQKKLKTKISGWIFLKEGPPISEVRMLYRNESLNVRYGLQREDVHQEFPGHKHALNSGFELKLDDLPGNPILIFQYRTEGSSWIEFDQRKPAQIPFTYYTDKKIHESKSGVRANVENAQIGRRYGHQFMFVGWCFRVDGKDVSEVRIRTGKHIFAGKTGLKRKDVFAENGNHHPKSLRSGFEIPLDGIPRTAKLKFEYKNPKGRWTVFALEDFSRFPVSHFASQSEEKRDFNKWLKKHEDLLSIPKDKAVPLLDSLANKPVISVIMPVYNTPGDYLRKAIQSVVDQYYQHWELCIADDASPDERVWQVLEAFAEKDARIKITRRKENGHICKASNSALELVTGEWCAFLDHDDTYPKDALLRAVQFINRHPQAGLFYSDEDKLDEEDHRHDPYFKPEWNPELLEGQNYLCHLTVTRSELVKQVGGFQAGLEGSQDWDLFLKITEQLETNQVVHIPYLLYHWRAIEGSTALALEEKGYIRESSLKSLQGHCERSRPDVEIIPIAHGHWRLKYPIPEHPGLVSIIIPTKDQSGILQACIDSIQNNTTYPNYEIVVVDNQSEKEKTKEFFVDLEAKGIRVLSYAKPFNFSAINNYAASEVEGEYLAFLNNDVTIINGEWLDEMISHACKEHVGAVGAKLYFPEDCIQHAGVILGINGIAGHCFKYAVRGEPGQRNRLNMVQQFSAITAACMVVKKSIFDQVEGFEEENLGVAFNDIDLCLRIREAGYANIWTPHAQLYHHESISRGDDNDQTRKVRVDSEIDYMRKRWGELLRFDPTYNPNLTLEFEDFSLAWPPRLPHKP